MKYFDELKMADIQKAFDSEVLEWKGVTSKPMMGCQCYFRGRKFICFLVTDGIGLMKTSDKDQDAVKSRIGGGPQVSAGQTWEVWVGTVKGRRSAAEVNALFKNTYEKIPAADTKTHGA